MSDVGAGGDGEVKYSLYAAISAVVAGGDKIEAVGAVASGDEFAFVDTKVRVKGGGAGAEAVGAGAGDVYDDVVVRRRVPEDAGSARGVACSRVADLERGRDGPGKAREEFLQGFDRRGRHGCRLRHRQQQRPAEEASHHLFFTASSHLLSVFFWAVQLI